MALFDNPTSPPTSGHEMARQKVDAAGNLSGSDFSAGMGIKVVHGGRPEILRLEN